MAVAPQQVGIGIRRYFTTVGVHPYDEISWETRDARITNYRDGAVAFEQLGVEVPAEWSLNATNILAQKYFRGSMGSPERERSLKQVADRVVDTISRWGYEGGYFVDAVEADAFNAELKHLIVTQKAAFNSPVWFNIGVSDVPQQASACFILAVDDTMDSILNWYVEEGTIFKGGSGSGINLSKIRSSAELLKGGGTASGPVSFMRGADASAGTIKSGGKTRRAAKMVILNVDHPDIEEFIWCKSTEERKARALEAAGFDMSLDGKDINSIQYQNANNSVRVTDEFMQAVVDGADWHLRAVTDGSVVKTIKARDLMRQLSQAAWDCADPGMQFDTTINRWHTAAASGRINGSNPCSEYMHLDNSACNLASLNLLKFLTPDDAFDVEGFKAAVEVVFTAQEILVGNADYPTEKIAENSRRFRQLGIGYANLGALLMALGLAYDSDGGRAWAGAITALLTGHSYEVSARIAARMGPFAGYSENAESMLRVLDMHRQAASTIDEELVPAEVLSAAQASWDAACDLGGVYGVRNAQASVLAPTGCLVGGSLVATDQGLVRLRSLGDPDGEQWQDIDVAVQTDGGVQSATKFYVNGLERVVDVTTSRGHRIQGTTKHRIKVVGADGSWVWRRFADLRPGDRVPLSLGQLHGAPREVRLPPLSDAMEWTGERHVRAPRLMTPELAELVGSFMGDGSLQSSGLRFCVADGDFEVVSHLEHLVKELFGVPARLQRGLGAVAVEVHSVRLAEWWRACGFAKREPLPGGSGGYQPQVPDAVLHTNSRDCYAAFVRGLYDVAGSVERGLAVWVSSQRAFSEDVQSLLLALGYPTVRSVGTDERGVERVALRPIDGSRNARWLDEVGSVSDRRARLVGTDSGSAMARERIPVPPSLLQQIVADGPDGAGMIAEADRHGGITRTAAEALHERSKNSELGRLLGYCYDQVAAAQLADEEFTYDLSVPENVTYLANGFVSHNTIGLLMDCDTTGIEPDLGLVKLKKLVGGGTMSIINQTIPRALVRLGYTASQRAKILAYIDEHKSVLGSPLKKEHVAVFSCSMGDNTIHHMGHIKMMAAVQPFISGAISKTVNMPEEATVADIEQLHIDAWQLGIKAIAIYRDNCKVAQPLSAVKKESEGAQPVDALTSAIGVVEKVVERVVTIREPVRERLPRNRSSKTFEFRVADCKGFVTVGEYLDGRPGEIFIKVSKQGSTLGGIMDGFAIAVSHALQYGVPLRSFVEAYTNTRFEPAGMTDDPDIRFASSLLDYIFRRLAVLYLSYQERAELNVLTVGERTQPTLPGVEEAVIETRQGLDIPADPPSIESALNLLQESPVQPSLLDKAGVTNPVTVTRTPPQLVKPSTHSDAPYCMQCGVQMQRAGSCHACPSCGSTSGCS